MDAKIWTVGATLFALLYLTLAISLVWSAVLIALLLAAWVMGMETEGPEGLKYVELEMRPALAFVGIFALTVVILGPHFPYVIGRSLYPIQYASPTSVLDSDPVLFYFPLVPLLTGSVMTIHQKFHPLQGILYQTAPSPSTGVHVHLHTSRTARSREEEDEEDADPQDEPRTKHGRAPAHHHLRHHLRRAPKVHTVAEDDGDEDREGDDEEDRPSPSKRHARGTARASQSADL